MTIERAGEAMRQVRLVLAGGSTAGLTDGELLERYAGRGDDGAFEAIVGRHGAMVLGVCRRVLGDAPEADDAFQAAFLVLARRAGGLRVGPSVAPWLFGVTRRVALRARARRGRLRARERPMADLPDRAGPADDESGAALRAILDEELARLPEKYRAPVVLCHLEGMTHEQAARLLGCPTGTVSVRLMRARDRLRGRLARRGLAAPSAFPTGLALRAALPPTLTAAATRVAASSTRPGAIPTVVVSLADGVILAMIRAKWLRLALATATGTALAAVASAGALVRLGPAPQESPAAVAEAGDATARPGLPVAGLVVDERGGPAEGGGVFYSTRRGAGWGEVVAEAVTDAGGRFDLRLPEGPDAGRPEFGTLWAFEPGKLVASIEGGHPALPAGLPARLALGPPARGTVFEVRGPDGRPVAGATIAPRVLNRGPIAVPDGLVDRIAADTVTDAEGRATLTAFLPEEISTVVIAAEGLGRQQFGFGHRDLDPGVKRITLLPVGRVVGRVDGPPDAVGGLRLEVGTNSPAYPSPYPGFEVVTTDADGRFEVPEIASGNLTIRPSRQDPESPWQVEGAFGRTVEPGETTEVAVPVSHGVLVTGLIRERQGGAPVEGARVGLGYLGAGPGPPHQAGDLR